MNLYSESYLNYAIQNISIIPENDIKYLIINYIDQICNDIIGNNYDYANVVCNHKFIDQFFNYVSSNEVTYTIRLCCNKLVYDYLTSDNKDEYIKQKFMQLSYIVNKSIVSKLLSIGLDEGLSSNIAISRYSSTNEIANSARLNFVLCKSKKPELLTEQKIIEIYEILYDRISNLFYATMFETYSEEELDIQGESFSDIYSTISLSILDMVNVLPKENIRDILKTYIKEYEYRNKPSVRFSLKAISNEYNNIVSISSELEMENKFVP